MIDSLYWEHLFDLLLNTLLQLTAVPPPTTTATTASSSSSTMGSSGSEGYGPMIWLTQTPRRNKVEQRFFKAANRHFNVSVALRTKYQSHDRTFVSIYQLQRKLSSLRSNNSGSGNGSCAKKSHKQRQLNNKPKQSVATPTPTTDTSANTNANANTAPTPSSAPTTSPLS